MSRKAGGMDGLAPLFVVGCLGLVALLILMIVVSVRGERRRQQRIRGWASHHGWTVDARPTVD